MGNPSRTGYIRITGTGHGDGEYPLTGEDIRVDALQADGSWLEIKGVCSVKVCMAAGEMVTATLVMEPHWLGMSQVLVASALAPTRWNRLRRWWRRTRLHARSR